MAGRLPYHGPLTRYIKLQVAHAPGMPGTFSPPPQVRDPDLHHGTCETHVPWCMPGSLTSGFRWSRWRGKRSRHFRRMRNLQFYVSGKRPMGASCWPWHGPTRNTCAEVQHMHATHRLMSTTRPLQKEQLSEVKNICFSIDVKTQRISSYYGLQR